MRLRRSPGKRIAYRGFSLVEILVTITIVSCIAIVAYVGAQWYIKRSYNSERIADVERLKGVFSEYRETHKTLPDPQSNAIRYDRRGVYSHSASGSYGVSGYLSRDLLGAKYTSTNMLDPETKQYYAYGKLADASAFDLATVVYEDGGYRSYLRGTYSGKDLVSLVRAYASSDFVVDGSSDLLPYNPIERKITARITSWSGSVAVSSSASLTGELNSGDTITVGTGGLALVSVSDGSELSLGFSSGTSMLELSSLAYSDEHNLVSRVALYLRSWEVWARAPELRTTAEDRSEFSIQSDTAVAAVRGTVFGVEQSSASVTSIYLANGRIETMEKASNAFTDPSIDSDSLRPSSSTAIFSSASGTYTRESGHTYMQTDGTSDVIRLDIQSRGGGTTNATGSIDASRVDDRFEHRPFSSAYHPRFVSITSSTGTSTSIRTISVRFENPGADRYRILFYPDASGGYAQTLTGTIDRATDRITATGSLYNTRGTLSLSLCRWDENMRVCSAETTQTIESGYFERSDLDLGWDRLDRPGESTDSEIATSAESICGSGQSVFGAFGCQDERLVAYAPYDTDNDLNLYSRWDSNTSHALALIKTGMTGNGYLVFQPGMSVPQFTTDNHWEGTPAGASIPTGVTKLANPGPFYSWMWTSTGILIPTSTGWELIEPRQPSSLRYNLSELSLTGSFAIEFGVRGGALRREYPSVQYYIATSKPFSGSSSTFRLYLDTTNKKLSLCNLSNCSHLPLVGWISSASNNTPYTVRYEKIGSVGKLSLLTSDNHELAYSPITSNPPFLNNPTVWGESWLYIGSDQMSTRQWNDIIDFVKVYKY